MDYRKFNRVNVIIELIGDALAAVLAAANIFIPNSYISSPLFPMMVGQIIKNIREIILTERDNYKQEDYLASLGDSYRDNRTLIVFKTVLCFVVVVLVIIKLIIRQVGL